MGSDVGSSAAASCADSEAGLVAGRVAPTTGWLVTGVAGRVGTTACVSRRTSGSFLGADLAGAAGDVLWAIWGVRAEGAGRWR